MTNSTLAYHNNDLKKFHSTGTLFKTLQFLRNLRMVSLSYSVLLCQAFLVLCYETLQLIVPLRKLQRK
jgi:hypothetical protein